MKKYYLKSLFLLVSILLFSKFSVYAVENTAADQKTLLEETFAEGQGQFTIEEFGSLKGIWEHKAGYTSYGETIPSVMRASARDMSNKDFDSFLISPSFKLTSSAKLSFNECSDYFFDVTIDKFISVCIRETGSSEWTTIDMPFYPENDQYGYCSELCSVKLPVEFIGKNIQIAFRYKYTNTTDAGDWRICNVKVCTTADTPTEKKDPNLSYSEKEVTYTIGSDKEFVAPILTNDNNLVITYSSNNENVATIDSEGIVTIIDEGETIIYARSEENETFMAGEASYKLIIYKNTNKQTVLIDGVYYTIKDDGTAIVTNKEGNKYSGDIVIPSEVTYEGKTYIVIRVGINAFNSTDVTSVKLPETVTSIGPMAFMWCENLTKVNIPSQVEIIEESTFANCFSLQEIIIPENISYIGANAFFRAGIKKISIPPYVTTIDEWAFAYSKLLFVTFEDSEEPLTLATTNENYAFDCCMITEIYYGRDVENMVFYDNRYLYDITFGQNVTKWNDDYNGIFNSNPEWLWQVRVKFTNPDRFIPNFYSETYKYKMQKDEETGKITYESGLYVPKGCKEAFANAEGWKNFERIVEEDEATGIEYTDIKTPSIVGYYTIDGVKLDAPRPGINVLKFKDGSTKKFIVR